jgi:hypothetical protein
MERVGGRCVLAYRSSSFSFRLKVQGWCVGLESNQTARTRPPDRHSPLP